MVNILAQNTKMAIARVISIAMIWAFILFPTTKSIRKLVPCILFAVLLAGSAMAGGNQKALHILQAWQGDYPVAQLNLLPEGQRSSRIGYLGNPLQFAKVWKVFKPSEELPDVDFSNHMVVFSRNVTFYNRTAIMKVMFREGVAEILARETMSAMPIEEKVAMSMAVIPRSGVNFISSGKEPIPVERYDHVAASGPMNTSYAIEGSDITLKNGHSEIPISTDSATKIRTFVSGNVIEGDLDGDGDKDAAVILVHDPGGSGTFYYVAVAENKNDLYRGTNGVWLGDRIALKNLKIRNGVVIAGYAKRGPSEPMSTAPSVEALLYLAFDEGQLKALKPLGMDEQILEVQIIIGHEVRSFYPCTQKTEYWLSGDSPALKEIIERYKKALPDGKPYTPLVMVLAGRLVEAPREGFGADYAGAFCATQVVAVRPKRD